MLFDTMAVKRKLCPNILTKRTYFGNEIKETVVLNTLKDTHVCSPKLSIKVSNGKLLNFPSYLRVTGNEHCYSNANMQFCCGRFYISCAYPGIKSVLLKTGERIETKKWLGPHNGLMRSNI